MKPPKSKVCARPVLSVTGSSDVTSTFNLVIAILFTYLILLSFHFLPLIIFDLFIDLHMS